MSVVSYLYQSSHICISRLIFVSVVSYLYQSSHICISRLGHFLRKSIISSSNNSLLNQAKNPPALHLSHPASLPWPSDRNLTFCYIDWVPMVPFDWESLLRR